MVIGGGGVVAVSDEMGSCGLGMAWLNCRIDSWLEIGSATGFVFWFEAIVGFVWD
jgi:hypothetical protein